ncbi:von Willebrand factor A domain-containing protein 5A-like [Ylistrum balloti]|uniref:von Willebrand factor A domain-containing protein 5A-like n=1 Tax=Ylistrum balloti TaxID=509963 RepID=UPI002905C204|nr:von Willebrand factor A domain-containing protein 5A-like [Ylistrum balloti]
MKWGLSCLKTGATVPLKEVQNVALIGASLVHVDSNLLYLNESDEPVEANFTFPLDTSNAVYRFQAEIDGRVIVAECQEKSEARDTYQQAVESGHTALLLEEHDDTNDVFVCRVGNLPPKERALLKICYVSELPHDPSGALRFTLPTVLNPRYGVESDTGPVNTSTDVVCVNPGSYEMNLDITVQSQHTILSIVSEKDQLQLSPSNDQHVWKASVKFGQGTKVDHDVSVLITYKDMHQPQAIVERGVKDQGKGMLSLDVLMLSFYPEIDPKFTTTHAELIFIVDRSGSMEWHDNIGNARDTLLLMIKSLPVGCFFNVYSFGNNFSILFDKNLASSVEYNEENMNYALDYVQKMKADMGGTEILKPLQDMYSKPGLPGYPRQVILLTDGQVWNISDVLEIVRKNNHTTRMFSVGIGDGASTALVKGLARAGKGRAEFVKGTDRLQTKVVSLLKSAMQAAVTNVQMELELPPDVIGTIVPHDCQSIFSGEELIMYAVLKGSESMDWTYGNIVLRGNIENHTFEHKLAFRGQHQEQNVDTSLPVHRLAAKALIQELEDEESAPANANNKKKIILASIATNVMSKYTSFVGVDKLSKVLQPSHSYVKKNPVAVGMFGARGGTSNLQTFCGSMNNTQLLGIGMNMFSARPGGMFCAKKVMGTFGAASDRHSQMGGLGEGNTFGGQSVNPFPAPTTFGFGGGPEQAANMFGAKPLPPTSVPQKTKLILLQGFDGSWTLNEELASFLKTTCANLQQIAPIQNYNVWATCLALAWLHLNESLNKDEWVLIESKALQWLKCQGLTDDDVNNVFTFAQHQMKNF